MDAIMECDIDSVRKSLYLEVSPLEEEHLRIEKEIALEQKNHPVLTISKVKFFLNQLKNGDINDIKYRKTLISVFVNQIYLYDDKITIIFNSGDKAVTINDLLLSEIEKEHKQNSIEPTVLRSIREEVLDNGAQIEAAIRKAKGFRLCSGNRLKRVPTGFPADSPYAEMLKLKDFYLEQPIAEEFLLAPDLLERTVEQFRRTQPFIAILNRAIRYAHEEMQ